MLPAARVTDKTAHPGGTVAGPGNPKVLIEGLPAAVAGVTQHACGMPPPAGPHPPTPFVGTSATVYPAAGLIEVAAAAGATVVSINTEPSGSLGARHIELVGAASTLLPALLEGLSPETRHG